MSTICKLQIHMWRRSLGAKTWRTVMCLIEYQMLRVVLKNKKYNWIQFSDGFVLEIPDSFNLVLEDFVCPTLSH